MRFRRTELDIGKSLHQVGSLSLPSGNEPVVFTLHLHAAWTYRGITKGTFVGHTQARVTPTLLVTAKARPMIVFTGSVK